MAQEWREVLGRRSRTSKTKRLYVDDQPTNKFSWDGQAGRSMHYLDGVGAWQDVDETAEESDTGGFSVKFTQLSYFVRVGNDGRRRFYPDRNDPSYWIEFKKPYPNMGAPTRHNRWFYWDFAHAVIGIRCDVDSLKFGFRLKDNQAPTSITIPFKTQGMTRQGRLLLRDGEVVAELRKPIATGSNLDAGGEPIQKECDVVFGPGEVTISLDPTGLEYPVEIDPTIDKQVGAGGDDGEYKDDCSWFSAVGSYIEVYGSTPADYQSFALFTGISGLSGSTVTVSHYDVYIKGGDGTPLTKLRAEHAEAPTAPSNCADANARTRTSAGVDWDGVPAVGWQESPSLNPVIQELADNFDPSAILILHDDDGSPDDHYVEYRAYEKGSHAFGPKLHIEWEKGAVPGYYQLQYTSEPPTPSAWNQLKREAGSGDYKKLLYEGE